MALVPRLLLLLAIAWVIGLTEPLFELFGHGFSGKDIILFAGGLFLLYKATHEIHTSLEGEEGEASARVRAKLAAVVTADHAAQSRVLHRFDRDGGRHGQRDLGDGGGDHPVDAGHAAGGAAGRRLRGAPPDGEDAGAVVPAADRHHADRRQLRRPYSQGLHLRGHGLLGVRRGPQHGAPPPRQAGASAPEPIRIRRRPPNGNGHGG